MPNLRSKTSKVYRDILLKYMTRFQLEAVDIAFLAKTTKSNIQSVLDLKGGLGLETMEVISKIFNLAYYEFGNPNHPMPGQKMLPQKTLERIAYRKKLGPHIEQTYNSLDINDKITIILSKFKKNNEFLTQEIANQIIAAFPQDPVNTSVVGDRLKKTFSQYVRKTEKQETHQSRRGPKPYFYTIVKEIPQDLIALAKEAIGTEWISEDPA